MAERTCVKKTANVCVHTHENRPNNTISHQRSFSLSSMPPRFNFALLYLYTHFRHITYIVTDNEYSLAQYTFSPTNQHTHTHTLIDKEKIDSEREKKRVEKKLLLFNCCYDLVPPYYMLCAQPNKWENVWTSVLSSSSCALYCCGECVKHQHMGSLALVSESSTYTYTYVPTTSTYSRYPIPIVVSSIRPFVVLCILLCAGSIQIFFSSLYSVCLFGFVSLCGFAH